MKELPFFVHHEGKGPALILLHSWCGSHRDWAKVMPGLSAHFSVYAWDARGHGKSGLSSDTPCTLTQLASDLNDLINHYDLDKPMVIGHSMGAFVLWQYLETYGQDRLSKIAIIDQTPKLLCDDTWDHGIYGTFKACDNTVFINALREDFAETVLKLAAFGHNANTRRKYEENSKGIQAMRAYLQTLSPAPLIDIWQDLTRADFRELQSRLTLPTLLVYGGKSNYYGANVADYMQQTITHNQMYFLEEGDHSPFLADPDGFVRAVMDFSD